MTYSFGGVKPYTPEEAVQHQITQIPDVVFEAVNRLLAKQALSSRIVIQKPDLIEEIRKLDGPDAQELYANKWLDIELAYRLNGWSVQYESPDWGSSGTGYFIFTKKTPAQER